MADFLHTPTGKTCTIIRRSGARSFCNFGSAADPFTWVNNAELVPAFLPEIAYAKHPIDGFTVRIERGTLGFFESPRFRNSDPDVLNFRLGVTPIAAAAMLAGSMFGWTCPAVESAA